MLPCRCKGAYNWPTKLAALSRRSPPSRYFVKFFPSHNQELWMFATVKKSIATGTGSPWGALLLVTGSPLGLTLIAIWKLGLNLARECHRCWWKRPDLCVRREEVKEDK